MFDIVTFVGQHNPPVIWGRFVWAEAGKYKEYVLKHHHGLQFSNYISEYMLILDCYTTPWIKIV